MFFSNTSDHLFVSDEEHRGTDVTPTCHIRNHSDNPKPSTTTKYYSLIDYHHEYNPSKLRNKKSTDHYKYTIKDK